MLGFINYQLLVFIAYGLVHLTRTVIVDGPQLNPGTMLPMLFT